MYVFYYNDASREAPTREAGHRGTVKRNRMEKRRSADTIRILASVDVDQAVVFLESECSGEVRTGPEL